LHKLITSIKFIYVPNKYYDMHAYSHNCPHQ